MAYTKVWWRLQIDRCLSEWAQNKWALLGWLAMQAATSTVEPVEVTRDLPPADISGLCGGGHCVRQRGRLDVPVQLSRIRGLQGFLRLGMGLMRSEACEQQWMLCMGLIRSQACAHQRVLHVRWVWWAVCRGDRKSVV